MLRKQMVTMAFDPGVHRRPLRGLILHKEYIARETRYITQKRGLWLRERFLQQPSTINALSTGNCFDIHCGECLRAAASIGVVKARADILFSARNALKMLSAASRARARWQCA
jgi:hypothetical protein